jgi:hypothetical protein
MRGQGVRKGRVRKATLNGENSSLFICK